MFVIFVVLYMPTMLAGCSVNPKISCGVHKIIRTPRIIEKKSLDVSNKSYNIFFSV
jgi:hypothetical protein